MGIEFEYNFGKAENDFLKELNRFYNNRLTAYGRKKIRDVDKWVKDELAAWKKGKRKREYYDRIEREWNFVPPGVAAQAKLEALEMEGRRREFERLLGGLFTEAERTCSRTDLIHGLQAECLDRLNRWEHPWSFGEEIRNRILQIKEMGSARN